MQSYDVNLGCDWIYKVSPIGLDLPLRTLTVTKNGRVITLTDHTIPHKSSTATCCNENNTKALLGYIIQTNALIGNDYNSETEVPANIAEILQQFIDVFQEHTSLTTDC